MCAKPEQAYAPRSKKRSLFRQSLLIQTSSTAIQAVTIYAIAIYAIPIYSIVIVTQALHRYSQRSRAVYLATGALIDTRAL